MVAVGAEQDGTSTGIVGTGDATGRRSADLNEEGKGGGEMMEEYVRGGNGEGRHISTII
jgi:hypothetical protein